MDQTTTTKLRGHSLLALLCLVSAFQLFSVSAFGVTNVVTFQLKSFTSDPVAARKVLVAPTAVASPSGALAVADRRMITTDTNASFSLTNMLPGTYGVTVQGPPQTTAFVILVGTNSGAFNAHDLLVVDTTATSPPDSVAWSTTASDARYEPIGGTTTAYATNAGSAQYAGTATNLLGGSNIVTRAELAGSNYLTAALAASQIAASNLLNAAQAASQIAASNLLTAPQVASQIAGSNLLNASQVGAQMASSNYMPAAQTSFTNVTLYGSSTNWTRVTTNGLTSTNTAGGYVNLYNGNVMASGGATVMGSVAIGAVSSNARLMVTETNGEAARFISSFGSSGGFQGQVNVGLSHWDSGAYPSTWIQATEDSVASYNASFAIGTRGSGADTAPTERVRITSAGNFGINTNFPAEKLDVLGNIHSTGSNTAAAFYGSGAGLTGVRAEFVPAWVVTNGNLGAVSLGSTLTVTGNGYFGPSTNQLVVKPTPALTGIYDFVTPGISAWFSEPAGNSALNAVFSYNSGPRSQLGFYSYSDMVFAPGSAGGGGTERARFLANGNFGLNNTNPTALVEIDPDTSGGTKATYHGDIRINDNTAAGPNAAGGYEIDAGSWGGKFYSSYGGDLIGIATRASSATWVPRLTISWNDGAVSIPGTLNSAAVRATNGVAIYRTTAWTTSDLATNGFAQWRSNNAIYMSIYVQGGGGYVTNKNVIPDF
jgi:hypothetical protein